MKERSQFRLQSVPAGVWVFLAAFLVQFFILQSIAETRYFLPESDDMRFYNDWAQRIAAGQWTDGKAFYGMPGFAYVLAGIYTLTGGYHPEWSPFLIGQLNAVCHALTATFIFAIGRRIFGADKSGTGLSIAAAITWLAMTPAQVFSAILMPTSWVICGYWGVAFFVVRAWQSDGAPSKRTWLLMGLGTGLVAGTVATILMLLPLMLFCIAFTTVRSEKRSLSLIASLAGAFVVSSSFSAVFGFTVGRLIVAVLAISAVALLAVKKRALFQTSARAALLISGVYLATSPIWLHNRLIAKDTVFLSAHDGLNFYVGNHSEANGYTKIPSTMSSSQEGMLRDSEIIPQKETGRPMERSEISAYWKNKANSFIRENPGSWLRLLWRKFENFFNVYQYDDLSILKLLRDEGAVPPGLRFGFVAALGLAGLPFCWARWKSSRWVIGAVLLHVASLMPVFITERYRLAAAPGLILLGVGGLLILWERLAAADWKKVGLSLASLAVTAWFCTLPRVDAGWALDFYKAGIRATQAAILAKSRGDTANAEKALDRAQRNLETAYAYVDQNADLVFAMGNLWMERGDASRAVACYERAVEISRDVNPARVHDGALTNLGIAASRKEDWAAAEQYFQESLKFDEADGKTWFFLAEARSKMRNRLGALEAVERARTLRPNQPEIEKLRDELRAQR